MQRLPFLLDECVVFQTLSNLIKKYSRRAATEGWISRTASDMSHFRPKMPSCHTAAAGYNPAVEPLSAAAFYWRQRTSSHIHLPGNSTHICPRTRWYPPPTRKHWKNTTGSSSSSEQQTDTLQKGESLLTVSCFGSNLGSSLMVSLDRGYTLLFGGKFPFCFEL